MGQYTTKGMLNGYKKNHKERAILDFYATPPMEVYNILKTLQKDNLLDLENKTILEPCCGKGDMISGILQFIKDENICQTKIIASDFLDRGVSR